MGSSTYETNSSPEERGDLTQIRGIGVVRKRWLTAVGIDTIAALAQASAEAIEAQARHDGRTLSRDELDAWIAQAQVLHVQASLEQATSAPGGAGDAGDDPSPLDSEPPEPDHDPELAPWHRLASFQVNYQTRQVNGCPEQRLVARHLETDDLESWADFATDLMQQWMGDRVQSALAPLQTTPSEAPTPVVAAITQLRIMQPHHMRQPMVADQTNPIFSDPLHRTAPFALEVSTQLAGLPAVKQAHPVTYRVQCLAHHLATGETETLGDVTTQVSPSDDSTYKVLLPPLTLMQPGIYRLKIVVTLQQAPTVLGQFKVPVLEVV